MKAYLRISDEQTAEDSVIMSMVASAVAWYESATGVFLRTTTLEHTFAESPVSFTYRPFKTLYSALDSDNVEQKTKVDIGEIAGGGTALTWDDTELGELKITVTVGHTKRIDIPDTAAQAVRALVADMYVNREYLNGNRMPSSVSAAMLLGESRHSL
tara:strand:+ start:1689 stop:2159 length:471 start_codon:yes stop_codon:yes gene_type:complete